MAVGGGAGSIVGTGSMFRDVYRIIEINNVNISVNMTGSRCSCSRRASSMAQVASLSGVGSVATSCRTVGADGNSVAGRATIARASPYRSGNAAATVNVSMARSSGARAGVGTGSVLGNICRVAISNVDITVGVIQRRLSSAIGSAVMTFGTVSGVMDSVATGSRTGGSDSNTMASGAAIAG